MNGEGCTNATSTRCAARLFGMSDPPVVITDRLVHVAMDAFKQLSPTQSSVDMLRFDKICKRYCCLVQTCKKNQLPTASPANFLSIGGLEYMTNICNTSSSAHSTMMTLKRWELRAMGHYFSPLLNVCLRWTSKSSSGVLA